MSLFIPSHEIVQVLVYLEVHLPVGTLVYENPPEELVPDEPDPDDPDALFEQYFMTGQERAELATVRAPQPGDDPSGPLLCDLDTPGKRVVGDANFGRPPGFQRASS